MEPRSDELMLEMDRVLPAAPALVFAAFVNPKELAKWWGPKGFTIPNLTFQARVGETYRINRRRSPSPKARSRPRGGVRFIGTAGG
ncbi:MAG: SRPBCC domain-containing protein, partial [Aeromicrobium sp.]